MNEEHHETSTRTKGDGIIVIHQAFFDGKPEMLEEERANAYVAAAVYELRTSTRVFFTRTAAHGAGYRVEHLRVLAFEK